MIPARLPGAPDHLWDTFGPTHRYVDFHSGWPWEQPGGDWIDRNGQRWGTTPWFSMPVGSASGATAVYGYDADVTDMVRHCQSSRRWLALLLTANAPRAIAGLTHPSQSAPFIDVILKSGRALRLQCRVAAANNRSSTGPSTSAQNVALPAFVEFDQPTEPVLSARLHLVVTEHWSGSNPTLSGFLLDPTVNTDSTRRGLAATAGHLDEGIERHAAVIGAHRYLDGMSLTDFAHHERLSLGAERNYDPAIFGSGPSDLSKLPYAGLGRWINPGDNWSLVGAGHVGDGFEPLAPGLGALKISMPAEPGVTDGSFVGNAGTVAGDSMIFLPEPEFGRLDRIFVRYYFRLGGPYRADAARRYQVYREPNLTDWTTYAGKFGIAPDHSTSEGGVSGSSGGGEGWQMRLSWYDCDAGLGGPDEGGWAVGYHLYDFYFRNPAGHNYGHGDGTLQDQQWGQRGGLGVLYAGQWYCIETELKLNRLKSGAPGYEPDGELRAWIDGRLAFERTGMVFRTSPVAQHGYSPDRLRPCRELGVRGLWLNWFHGGRTVATFDRTIFYTGLVWSREYVGPMNV